jgi:predicted AlkP superfamily phosphohydrolase/phosphomutase
MYNWRPVRPGSYERTRQPPGTCRKTFWRLLHEQRPDARAVVFDAPFSTPLRDDRITEVVGWGERGAVRRESWPPGLVDEITTAHGAYPRWTEDDYDRSAPEERRLLRALEDAIHRRTSIVSELLTRGDDWNLALACYYELHNGGHAFYRGLHPDADGNDRRTRFRQAALLRLYQAADAGIGRLRSALGDDVDILVCSGKGFRPNTNGETVLPQLLERLGYQAPGHGSPRSSGIKAARAVVRAVTPRPVRRRIFGQVSTEARDQMLQQLWIESVDWASSRAFAEPDLGSGFVRLNVRGREPAGIVEPGAEYERLAAEITEQLLRLTHDPSGAPAVERVQRREEIAPGASVELLPDLVISWSHDVLLDAVRHPDAGTVRERMRWLPTSEHRGAAFLIGDGPRLRGGASVAEADLADVAATILHLAGCELPRDMDGRALTDLLTPSAGPERRADLDWALDPWAPGE